jgi:hypothetical protein
MEHTILLRTMSHRQYFLPNFAHGVIFSLNHLANLLRPVSHAFAAIGRPNAVTPTRDSWFLFANQGDRSAHAPTLETGRVAAAVSQQPFRRSNLAAAERVPRTLRRQILFLKIQTHYLQSPPPLAELHSKYRKHLPDHTRAGSNRSTSPTWREWT